MLTVIPVTAAPTFFIRHKYICDKPMNRYETDETRKYCEPMAISVASFVIIDINVSGMSSVNAKNTSDNPPAYSMMNAKTRSTAFVLPAPQYWATRMLMPSVSAVRHKLKMNWNCVARDTADSSF